MLSSDFDLQGLDEQAIWPREEALVQIYTGRCLTLVNVLRKRLHKNKRVMNIKMGYIA